MIRFPIDTFFFRLALLVVVVSLTTGVGTIVAGEESRDQMRESAVLQARAGDIEKGVARLEELLVTSPQDIMARSDLAVILTWAGQDQRAVEVFSQRPPEQYPAYVLPPMIAALRRVGLSERALGVLGVAEGAGEISPKLKLLKVQLLIDLARGSEARELFSSIRSQDISPKDYNQVGLYLFASSADWIKALSFAEKILAVQPDDISALQGRIRALKNLGASHLATLYSNEHPELFNDENRAALRADRAGLLLRWSGHAAASTEESRLWAARALSELFAARMAVNDIGKMERFRRRIEYDQVVALRHLNLPATSYEFYEKLLDRGEVPEYVSREAAVALLESRRPEAARDMLLALRSQNPEDFELIFPLFYSLIECEQYDDAYELIRTEMVDRPVFVRYQGSRESYPNPRYLNLAVTEIQARLYRDQLADGWQKISALRRMAPGNDWLLQVSGDMAQARGWPRTALREYQLASLQNPENLGALAGKVQSLLQLHRSDEAGEILARLQGTSPLSREALALSRDLAIYARTQLWSDFVFSHSNGPEQTGDGILATAELLSIPLANHLRLVGLLRYNWVEIPEGEERLTRYGGGLRYQYGNWALDGDLNYTEATRSELGGRLKAVWSPDDFWHLSLEGDRFSEATPLRAVHYDIRGDRLKSDLAYRWDESRKLSFSLSRVDFTDDNERYESGLQFRQRLLDRGKFDVDGLIDLYGSKNSRKNAPYFNPESDFSSQLGLDLEHVITDRYDRSWTQQAAASIGYYQQEGYDGDWIGHLKYLQKIGLYPDFEGRCGVEVGRRVYDGDPEPYYSIELQLHARF